MPLSTLLDLSRQENQHQLLGQAASTLNVPLPVLLELSRRQRHLHKKPRLGSSTPMSTPYQDDPTGESVHEKPPLDGLPGRRAFAALSDGFPSGWTPSRLADCMASFPICPPCSTYNAQSSEYAQGRARKMKTDRQPQPTSLSLLRRHTTMTAADR